MKDLEQVRLETIELKNLYINKEQLIQNQLQDLEDELMEELNSITEESYIELMKDKNNHVSFDTYIDRVKTVIEITHSAITRLKFFTTNINEQEDYNNLNFSLANLYTIKGALEYMDEVYEVYKEYLE